MNKDGSYILVSSLISSGVTNTNVYCYFDGELTTYAGQVTNSATTVINGALASANAPYVVIGTGTVNLQAPAIAHIVVRNGYASILLQCITNGVPDYYQGYTYKSEKLKSGTSILLKAGNGSTNAIGAGSRFMLFKYR